MPLLEPVWWNWYLAGVVLMSLELLLPGVFLLWFGLGALATGLVVQLAGGFYWPYQLAVCAAISLLSVWVGRRVIRRARPATDTTLNRRLYTYLGRQAILEEPLRNGRGRVKMDGVYWMAKGPDLPTGTRVVVAGVEDSSLILARDEH